MEEFENNPNLHLESKGKVFSHAKELRDRMTEAEAKPEEEGIV